MDVRLQIECMTLAQQARITRKFEAAKRRHAAWLKHWHADEKSKLQETLFEASLLHTSRVGYLRKRIRASNLARGFLLGKPYVEMERTSYTWPDWSMIEHVAFVFRDEDSRVLAQRFAEWREDGMKRGLIHENPKGPAARVHWLARGFLKGKPYAEMEPYAGTLPDWDAIKKEARVLSLISGLDETFAIWRAKGESTFFKRGIVTPSPVHASPLFETPPTRVKGIWERIRSAITAFG